jgi:hypothetical protein
MDRPQITRRERERCVRPRFFGLSISGIGRPTTSRGINRPVFTELVIFRPQLPRAGPLSGHIDDRHYGVSDCVKRAWQKRNPLAHPVHLLRQNRPFAVPTFLHTLPISSRKRHYSPDFSTASSVRCKKLTSCDPSLSDPNTVAPRLDSQIENGLQHPLSVLRLTS